MRTRTTLITMVLLVTVAVLLVAGSIAAGAVPAPLVEMPPPPDGEARHYDLGNGHYVAIIPAAYGLLDTYNQEPYVDTYVYSHAPTSSYCTNTAFVVGHDDTEFGNERWRSYLGFHLSSIPSNATVTSARFYAYMYSGWGRTGGATIYLRRVTEWWTCTTANPLTWNNKPASTSVGQASRTVGTSTGWYDWNVTSLVQNYWIGRDFGTPPNYGFELRGPESGEDYMRYFRTKNYTGTKYHPYLVVEYELPTDIHAHEDAHAHPDPHTHSHPDADAYSHPHSDPYPHANAHPHPDAYTHADAHPDVHSYSHPDTYVHADLSRPL